MTDLATDRIEANESAQVFCRALDAHDWPTLSALVDKASLDDESDAGHDELARSLADIFGPGPSAQVSRTWLGVIAEPPDLAHVIYRARFIAIPDQPGSVGIISLRRHEAGWRVILDGSGPLRLPGFGADMYVVARAQKSTHAQSNERRC